MDRICWASRNRIAPSERHEYRLRFVKLLLSCWFVLVIPCASVQGQEDANNGARIFPDTTSLFLQVDQPDELIDKLWNHPLRSTIESLPQVQQGLKSAEFAQAKMGVAFMEARIGESWLPAIKKLTGNGLYVGAELQTQSVGIAFQSSDEALLKKTAGEILGFIKGQGGDEAFEIEAYRSGKFANLEDVIVARFGEWFIVSNKSAYAKKMADNLLDGIQSGKELAGTLAMTEVFQKAWKSIPSASDIRTFTDLGFLREAGLAKDLFQGSTDNPGVELFIGGILEALEDANHLAAGLQLSDDSLSVSANLPFQAESFRPTREFYFGNRSMGRAPVNVDVPDMLAQLTTYRDLGRWWLNKEELFPENVIAELALADSQLSTFFGGADFGEEILGALQPGLQLVAKEQTWSDGSNPDIKLPSFALIGRLQNPAREARFRISFNSFISILNLSEENEMPQFDVQTMNQGDYRITSARYLLEDATSDGLLFTNFSPSIAFQDDYMIISSTEQFAHELAKATLNIDNDATTDSNTRFELSAAALKNLLQANRKALVAQSMVEGGKSREQSAAEIDLALSLLDSLKGARLDYRVESQQMVLDVRLDFNQ